MQRVFGIVIFVIMLGVVFSLSPLSHVLLRDFYGFWTAGRLTLVQADIYNYSLYPLIQIPAGWDPAVDGLPAMPFAFYPPWMGIFFAPFGLLSYDTARSWWLALNFGMIGGFVLLQENRLEVWVATLLFPFLLAGLAIGQGAILGLLLVSLLLYCFKKERYVAGGIVLALSLSRPQLTWGIVLLSLIVLLRQKRWDGVLGFGGTLGILIGVSFLVWTDWPRQLYQGVFTQQLSAADRPWVNPTSYSFFSTLLGINFQSFMVWLIFSFVIILLLIMICKDLQSAVMLGISLAFLAGYYLRPYDLTIILIPFLFLLRSCNRKTLLVLLGGLLVFYGQEIFLVLTNAVAYQVTLLWLAFLPLTIGAKLCPGAPVLGASGHKASGFGDD